MALSLQSLQSDLYRAKEGPLRQWIEQRLSIKLQGARLADDLSDGTVLCQLMLNCKEGSVPRINNPEKGAFKQKENIIFFTSALEDLGIFRKRIFEVNDLFDRKNVPKVIDCLEELKEIITSQEREKEAEKAKATAALYEAITPRGRQMSTRAENAAFGDTLAVPAPLPSPSKTSAPAETLTIAVPPPSSFTIPSVTPASAVPGSLHAPIERKPTPSSNIPAPVAPSPFLTSSSITSAPSPLVIPSVLSQVEAAPVSTSLPSPAPPSPVVARPVSPSPNPATATTPTIVTTPVKPAEVSPLSSLPPSPTSTPPLPRAPSPAIVAPAIVVSTSRSVDAAPVATPSSPTVTTRIEIPTAVVTQSLPKELEHAPVSVSVSVPVPMPVPVPVPAPAYATDSPAKKTEPSSVAASASSDTAPALSATHTATAGATAAVPAPIVPPKHVRQQKGPSPRTQLHANEQYIPSPEGSDDESPTKKGEHVQPKKESLSSSSKTEEGSPPPKKESVSSSYTDESPERTTRRDKKEKRDKTHRHSHHAHTSSHDRKDDKKGKEVAEKPIETAKEEEKANKEIDMPKEMERAKELEKPKEAEKPKEPETKKSSMLSAVLAVATPPGSAPGSARDDWVDSPRKEVLQPRKESVPVQNTAALQVVSSAPATSLSNSSTGSRGSDKGESADEKKDKRRKKERDQSPLAQVATTRKSSHHRTYSQEMTMAEKRHSLATGDPRKESKDKKGTHGTHRKPRRPIIIIDRDPITGLAKLNQEPVKKIVPGIIRIQAWVRGHVARRRYTERLRAQAYRENVVKELLKTETYYAKRLGALVNVFVRPLKKVAQAQEDSQRYVSSEDVRALFSDIEIILSYSLQLQADLTPVVENFSASSLLGKVFRRFADFLKAYTGYVKNYNQSLARKADLMNNNKFAFFMREAAKHPDVNGETFEALLILPIQRVPRYELLLKDLIKHTWADHPDLADLTTSYDKIKEVAVFLNEGKRSAERMAKVYEVQNSIEKCEQLTTHLDRFYIREETIGLIYTIDEKHVERHVFLFSDVLVVTTKPTSLLGGFLPFGAGSFGGGSEHKNAYVFDTQMRLSGCSVRDVPQADKSQRFALDLLNKADLLVLTLLFPSQDVKSEWAADLHERCTQLAARSSAVANDPKAIAKGTQGVSGLITLPQQSPEPTLRKGQVAATKDNAHRRAKSINVASDVASRLTSLISVKKE